MAQKSFGDILDRPGLQTLLREKTDLPRRRRGIRKVLRYSFRQLFQNVWIGFCGVERHIVFSLIEES